MALTESVTAPTVAVSTAPRGHTGETTGGRLPETGGAARASKRLQRTRAPLAAVATLIGVLLGPGFVTASAAAEAPGDVLRLAVVVDLEHPVSGADADDLGRSLAAFVAARGPAVALDAASPDRLRLTVSVRPYSSTALRGFFLPFSGTYAIGPVRLSLERTVALPGRTSDTFTAIVWQREQVVATRWSTAGPAIGVAVQNLLDALQAAGAARP